MTDSGNWPFYEADELSLGNPESCVGVCCLWTDRRRLAEQLDPQRYAAIGNLYSSGGVGPLVRNLMANPRLRYLVVCGSDLSGSGAALVALFQDGLAAGQRIAATDTPFDTSIPPAAVDDLRSRVQLVDLRGVGEAATIEAALRALPPLPPVGEPSFFAEPEPDWETLPSERTGYLVRETTIARAWLESLKLATAFGEIKQRPGGTTVRNLAGLVVVVEQPPDSSAFPSWLPFDRDEAAQAADAWWPAVSELTLQCSLRGLPFAAPSSSSVGGAVLWSGLASHGQLALTACFLSQDLIQEWPTDVAAVALVHNRLASQLGLPCGPLTLLSQAAQLERAREPAVNELLSRRAPRLLPWHADPRGVFHVRLADGQIVVEHAVHDLGRSGRRFSGTAAERLYKAVVNSRLVLLPEHAAYLGAELQKAEIALRLGIGYRQDEPLELPNGAARVIVDG